MATYAYVRVSSADQNENRQVDAMHNLDIPDSRIFIDKRSGKDFNRPAYLRLVEELKPRDLLCIKSIDRLGRDYQEIQEQWRILTREKKVDICVLDMDLLDTRKGKDLLGTLISDLVLQLLSYVAETERKNIRARQAEGIAAAKARGVHFGRRCQKLPENFEAAYRSYRYGPMTSREAANSCGMAKTTFLRAVAQRETGEKRPT